MLCCNCSTCIDLAVIRKKYLDIKVLVVSYIVKILCDFIAVIFKSFIITLNKLLCLWLSVCILCILYIEIIIIMTWYSLLDRSYLIVLCAYLTEKCISIDITCYSVDIISDYSVCWRWKSKSNCRYTCIRISLLWIFYNCPLRKEHQLVGLYIERLTCRIISKVCKCIISTSIYLYLVRIIVISLCLYLVFFRYAWCSNLWKLYIWLTCNIERIEILHVKRWISSIHNNCTVTVMWSKLCPWHKISRLTLQQADTSCILCIETISQIVTVRWKRYLWFVSIKLSIIIYIGIGCGIYRTTVLTTYDYSIGP